MYYLFHWPPLFLTAGSGGALWVQRNSPDFRADPKKVEVVGSDGFVHMSIVPLCEIQKVQFLHTFISLSKMPSRTHLPINVFSSAA